MAYFAFKLWRMWDSSEEWQYEAARHSLTTFAVLAILLLVVTIVTAILCLRNFNKGLKPHIQKRKVPDAAETKYGGYAAENYGGQHPLDNMGNRMTID